MPKANIYLLACGGTIAGKSDRAEDLTGYTAGAASLEELLKAVPSLQDYAHLQGEQFCSLDSSDMSEALWLSLARRVRQLLVSPKVDGLVITHGTDTLEETAYFLQLTVPVTKPIILTGSMRPATALSADGPLNLLEAVQAASFPELVRCGVSIVFNSRIYNARLVEKTDTTHVDTFTGRQFGCLGVMQDGRPYLYQLPTHLKAGAAAFPLPEKLPRVKILSGYVGLSPEDCLAATRQADGLVFAGLGHGRLPASVWQSLQPLVKKGFPLVRASRTLGGLVSQTPEYQGTLTADTLTPQKAKILLQLALTQTRDLSEIQAIFARY